jgi:chorismate synthase
MTFGESHGPAVGVIVDGCPAGLALTSTVIQRDLDRRRPGQSSLVSPRAELDQVELLAGIEDGITLGTPIAMLVRNIDMRSPDYRELANTYRPSHADYSYEAKYGRRATAGGGRASARETIGRVAAGAVARALLACRQVEILAWVERIHEHAAWVDPEHVTAEQIEHSAVRCPDLPTAERMGLAIEAARSSGDSLGGVIGFAARGVPAGLGEPVFDKLEADLAKAMLSIPAARGFEIGSGFAAASLRGSEHNDPFIVSDGRMRTATNRSGGVQGGISNGETIYGRVAFKPPATIAKPQPTVTRDLHAIELSARGRHDPCVLPRAVVIVEAMAALVLADHWLRHRRAADGTGFSGW